jgi:hypothetical protein
VFQVDAEPDLQCVIIDDSTVDGHIITQFHMGADLLVESGSFIMPVGASDIFSAFVSPSLSVIRMRSATGQVVCPKGEGQLPFDINDGEGSVSILRQHTTSIKSSIFSPAETCNTLNYDSYRLMCDVRHPKYNHRPDVC